MFVWKLEDEARGFSQENVMQVTILVSVCCCVFLLHGVGTHVEDCLSDTSCCFHSTCVPRSWKLPANSTLTSTTSSCVEALWVYC